MRHKIMLRMGVNDVDDDDKEEESGDLTHTKTMLMCVTNNKR